MTNKKRRLLRVVYNSKTIEGKKTQKEEEYIFYKNVICKGIKCCESKKVQFPNIGGQNYESQMYSKVSSVGKLDSKTSHSDLLLLLHIYTTITNVQNT